MVGEGQGGRGGRGGGSHQGVQGVWYSMPTSPEVSAMHVIFGKRAQQ